MTNSVISPAFDEMGRPLRRIRSFVRRQGRLTKGQQQAIDLYWQQYGVDYQPEFIDLTKLFANDAPITVEIGFGMGHSLVAMAQANPQHNFLGIEVHLPGVGACLAAASEAKLTNLRVVCHDAVEVLQHCISDGSLQMVQLFFPDPWHKARHNKRRIVQSDFVQLIQQKLAIDGMLHMATDWQPYAEHMLAVMQDAYGFANLSPTADYVPRPSSRPETKFEKRGKRLGHGVWDLLFIRDN